MLLHGLCNRSLLHFDIINTAQGRIAMTYDVTSDVFKNVRFKPNFDYWITIPDYHGDKQLLYFVIWQNQLMIWWSEISIYWLYWRVKFRPSNHQLMPSNNKIQHCYLLTTVVLPSAIVYKDILIPKEEPLETSVVFNVLLVYQIHPFLSISSKSLVLCEWWYLLNCAKLWH